MASFFGGLNGGSIDFPAVVMNQGPLPTNVQGAGEQFNTPDGRINQVSASSPVLLAQGVEQNALLTVSRLLRRRPTSLAMWSPTSTAARVARGSAPRPSSSCTPWSPALLADTSHPRFFCETAYNGVS